MKCLNCGAPLKEGAGFCTSCGTKVEKIDMNKVMNSDLPDLFTRNAELMAELSKNFEDQKKAIKLTESHMLGIDKEVEKAKAETAAIQKKLEETEAILKQKLDVILEKEREIFALKNEINNMPKPVVAPVVAPVETPAQAPVEAPVEAPKAPEEIPVAEGEVVDAALKCPNCGNNIKEGMAFCNQCGTKIQ